MTAAKKEKKNKNKDLTAVKQVSAAGKAAPKAGKKASKPTKVKHSGTSRKKAPASRKRRDGIKKPKPLADQKPATAEEAAKPVDKAPPAVEEKAGDSDTNGSRLEPNPQAPTEKTDGAAAEAPAGPKLPEPSAAQPVVSDRRPLDAPETPGQAAAAELPPDQDQPIEANKDQEPVRPSAKETLLKYFGAQGIAWDAVVRGFGKLFLPKPEESSPDAPESRPEPSGQPAEAVPDIPDAAEEGTDLAKPDETAPVNEAAAGQPDAAEPAKDAEPNPAGAKAWLVSHLGKSGSCWLAIKGFLTDTFKPVQAIEPNDRDQTKNTEAAEAASTDIQAKEAAEESTENGQAAETGPAEELPEPITAETADQAKPDGAAPVNEAAAGQPDAAEPAKDAEPNPAGAKAWLVSHLGKSGSCWLDIRGFLADAFKPAAPSGETEKEAEAQNTAEADVPVPAEARSAEAETITEPAKPEPLSRLKAFEQFTSRRSAKTAARWEQCDHYIEGHRSLRILRKTVIILLVSCLGTFLLSAVTYIGLLQYSYKRFSESSDEDLSVVRNRTWYLGTEDEYTMLTYDLGAGMYSEDFSYYQATGTDANGFPVTGKQVRPQSADDVSSSMSAAVRAAKDTKAEIFLFQQVDKAATRSFRINEADLIDHYLPRFSKIYAVNYQTMYLFCPLNQHTGIINSGIYTLSEYKVAKALRKELPLRQSFFSKFSAKDTCASVSYLPVSGTSANLALINVDLSEYPAGAAWDDQFKAVMALADEEYDAGNYVIIGGNFHAALGGSGTLLETKDQAPKRQPTLDQTNLRAPFTLVVPDNQESTGTYRLANRPYEKGVSYETITDGYIVSDNVQASSEIIDTGYRYSNHNPVRITFSLLDPKK